MARKLIIAYFVYTVLIFLSNTYIFKESYADAIVKAVLSGVVFTAVYAFIIIRNEKRQNDEKAAATPPKKKR
jgi:arginine exporter protein ArgO